MRNSRGTHSLKASTDLSPFGEHAKGHVGVFTHVPFPTDERDDENGELERARNSVSLDLYIRIPEDVPQRSKR